MLTFGPKIFMIKYDMKNIMDLFNKGKAYVFQNPKKIVIGLVIFVLLLLVYYFYNQYRLTQQLLQNPSATSNAETKALIDSVGKLILLPIGEQPTIATVTDITKLSDQPIFTNAENGDKVLIFQKAGEVIIYRPKINKIIQVAPVNLGINNSLPQVSVNPSPASATPAVQGVSPTVFITPVPTK